MCLFIVRVQRSSPRQHASHSSRSCLLPFYTIPIFPLLNRKIFHLLVNKVYLHVYTCTCNTTCSTCTLLIVHVHCTCTSSTLLFQSPVNYVHSHHRQNQFYYRNEIISHLDTNYHLLSHICQNLELYMRNAREACQGQSTIVHVQYVYTMYMHVEVKCVYYMYMCTLHFVVVRIW